MLALIFTLPFAAALLCLALNRVVSTRWLGIEAAGALLLAAGTLLLAPPTLALTGRVWVMLGDRPVLLALGLDAVSRPFAFLVLAGGALALLALALALPADLRGFGGLFAALLLALLATIAGLANQEPLLLSFAWALTALLGFVALRASGTTAGSDMLPVGLLAGLISALLLLAAALTSNTPASSAALACWTLVGLLAFGGPLFHALLDAPAEAPAALAGVLIPLGLPLLGGFALIRFTTEQWPSLPPDWHTVWTLLGLLGLLACAASATGTTRIRQLIGWQFSAQMGLVLIAIGLNGGLPPLAGAAGLLMNAALTALVCYLALAVLERRAGTDDLAQIGAHGPLTLPGLAFMFAAVSSVGIPGTWGWWTQSALIDGLRYTTPWLVPLLLAGNTLRALAYVAPLAAFWRAAEARPMAQATTSRRSWPTIAVLLCPAIAALPLLVWGVAPQLAWRGWLGPIQGLVIADGPELSAPDILTQIAVGLAAFALVALPLLAARGRARREPAELDLRNMALLTPQALGQSLHGLSWLGDSADLFRSLWDGLLRLSRTTTRLLALFEQRYYLAGLMIALIVVIMLFF